MFQRDFLFRWMFHEVVHSQIQECFHYAVTEEAFRLAVERAEKRFPGKILYTFDDGHSSDLEISLPILEELDAVSRGYFFITTSWIGSGKYMSRIQVRELSRRGAKIGTHGHTHSYFSGMSNPGLEQEVRVSKQILEDITGLPVDTLSIPGGRFDTRLRRIAGEVGYVKIFTSEPGDNSGSGIPVLGRLIVNRNNIGCLPYLHRGQWVVAYSLRAKHAGKRFLRRCLGEKAYYSLWSRVMKKT